jgi:hypothetical protein
MIDGSVPDAEMDAFDRRCVPSGTELYNQTPAGSESQQLSLWVS